MAKTEPAKKLNDDFDVLGLNDGEKPAKATAPKVGPKALDPEDDRDNWPTIMISSEDGKPNYETVIVHGTKRDGTPFGHDLQIMRGVQVKVPPSVVYCLQDAVATHIVAGKDRDGHMVQIRQERPSVPWQLINKGKYVK